MVVHGLQRRSDGGVVERHGPVGGAERGPLVDHLAALVKLIDTGAVNVGVEASRPLAELASVHRDAEAGRISGKTIIVPEGIPS
jgi:NADPH:quinone reductase-like Zn-dependent oxidoreductase